MNVIQQALKIPGGMAKLISWVGSGGEVVERNRAQGRANICLQCPQNKPLLDITQSVAEMIKSQLEFKNDMKLAVDGDDRLEGCHACGCVLKLLIWEPQDRVSRTLTEEEAAGLPVYCWKREQA